MEYNHPPVVDGESVQKQTNAVWEKRPTLVPITVILRESLPKREIQIMHPLHVGSNTDFTKQQAHNLAKEVNGDQNYIFKQLDGINRMFKDGDKRALDPKLAVLTLVVPTHHESYFVLHRCIWDLNTPLAMINMYCEEILRDIGLGLVVAHEMAKYMKSLVETVRKSREHTINPTARMGSDIIIPQKSVNSKAMRFPVVLKSKEDAERLKEALKDVEFGHEGTVLELSHKNASDDAMMME